MNTHTHGRQSVLVGHVSNIEMSKKHEIHVQMWLVPVPFVIGL